MIEAFRILLIVLLMVSSALIIPPAAGEGNGISEAFVSTDSPLYCPGNTMVAEAFIYYSSSQSIQASVSWSIIDMTGAPVIPSKTIILPATGGGKGLSTLNPIL
jgi:hypothetical protein